MTNTDRDVLRRLAEQQVKIGSDPVQERTAAEWARLSALGPGRPLVWITEIPWHELEARDVEGELAVQCRDPFLRGIEREMRRQQYQWRHLPADMVVEPVLYCPLAVHDDGFGIAPLENILRTDASPESVMSHLYRNQINSPADVEKIKAPAVWHDQAESDRRYELLSGAVGDILPVRRQGVVWIWFAPWDQLVTWWGVEQVLTDLIDRPELVHAAMDRLVNAHLRRLEQWEQLGVFWRNDANLRIGSGGPGYCDEIGPGPDSDGPARAVDNWGAAAAQIFSAVSPEMHEEFALRYERRWLERFALTYYGCCEPLHHKMDILKSVGNLRKVSMSPQADVVVAAEVVGDRYVYSAKPNPAILAPDRWNPDSARSALRELLDQTRGCRVEIILKDISTVRYDPRRLWEWSEIARQECEALV